MTRPHSQMSPRAPHRPKWTVTALLALVLATVPACKDDVQVVDTAGACDNVDCSGHGQCVVTQDGQATCMCDPGFRTDGADCTAVEAGHECDNVDCSGHGQCVVVDAEPKYPFCICDDGFQRRASTECVPASGNVECGAGTVLMDGVCVPADAAKPPEDWQRLTDGPVFPGTVSMSPDGRWVTAATMHPVNSVDSPGWDGIQPVFEPDSFVLFDLQSDSSEPLYDATLHCGTGGCYVDTYPLGFSADSSVLVLTHSGDLVFFRLGTGNKVAIHNVTFQQIARDGSFAAITRFTSNQANGHLDAILVDTSTGDERVLRDMYGANASANGVFLAAGDTFAVVSGGVVSAPFEITSYPLAGGDPIVLAGGDSGHDLTSSDRPAVAGDRLLYLDTSGTLQSISVAGGEPTPIGPARLNGQNTSGGNVVDVSPSGTDVLVPADLGSWYMAPAAGGGTTTDIPFEAYGCRWMDDETVACVTADGAVQAFDRSSQAVTAILSADAGVIDLSVSSGRGLFWRLKATMPVWYTQGDVVGADAFEVGPLSVFDGQDTATVWPVTEASVRWSYSRWLPAMYDADLTTVAVPVLYFDVLRGYAPSPLNGLWIAPIP